MRCRVRNDPYGKGIVRHLGDGQAHSIDGHGTLECNVSSKIRRHLEIDPEVGTLLQKCSYGYRRVHMPLNKVPPDSAIG